MRIVIIGVGEVGFHVAKALSEEDHDITVMDLDPKKCKRATESLDVIVRRKWRESQKLIYGECPGCRLCAVPNASG